MWIPPLPTRSCEAACTYIDFGTAVNLTGVEHRPDCPGATVTMHPASMCTAARAGAMVADATSKTRTKRFMCSPFDA
jgi:hypothetical protein